MHEMIKKYNEQLSSADQAICDRLAALINEGLIDAENKIWHAHPVWFLAENPIVGYSKQKAGIRLMFWSGADFAEEKLNILGRKFKDASIIYNDLSDIKTTEIKRWLNKSKVIQWDYKNIVKRKGKLERLT